MRRDVSPDQQGSARADHPGEHQHGSAAGKPARSCGGERRRELRPAGPAIGRRRRERPRHCPLDRLRDLPHRPQVGNRLAEPLRHDRPCRRTGVWRFSREHLVQHAAEAVHVTPTIDVDVAGSLLGAHVGRRAEHQPGIGELVAAGRDDRPGNPEVGDDRLSVGQEDVFGLDVSMHDTLSVRVIESLRHLARNPKGVG